MNAGGLLNPAGGAWQADVFLFELKRNPARKRENLALDPSLNPTPSLSIVMLILKEPLIIDNENLLETLCNRYRKDDGMEPIVSVMNGMVIFAGVAIAVLAPAHPLPDDWRELAAPGRNPHWPQAREVCGAHRAHLILSIMGEQPDILTATRVLTAVAGAIASLYPDKVLAGFWDAKILNSCETWARLSALAFAPYPNLPLGLWVSQHPFADEKTGGLGVVTQGLARFVGRELEFVAPGGAGPSDLESLLDRAFGLTIYLVQNGPVLKDGSTFGVSETERIGVALRDSIRFPGLPVIAASVE